MSYGAISADSHIVEPPHLWEKWLAPELRKFAPKLGQNDPRLLSRSIGRLSTFQGMAMSHLKRTPKSRQR